MSWGTVARIPLSGAKECLDYNAFGTCEFNFKCQYDHSGEICGYDFFFGKLISEIGEGDVTLREPNGTRKKFHIRPGDWCRAGAKNGDFVLFQKSDQKIGNLNTVRVVLVLCENSDMMGPMQLHRVKSAFTLDMAGTRRRDDAISVEACEEEHSECTQIGIHIVAVNERGKKVRADSIPPYGSTWTKYEGFDRGKLSPALSVFFHTSSDEVLGPVLSVVQVDENYECGAGDIKGMDELWKFFVGSKFEDRLPNSNLSRYPVEYPKSWRDCILLDLISEKYSKAVTKIFRSAFHRLENGTEVGISFVTTKPLWEFDYKKTPEVTAFEDEFHQATTGNDKLVLFLSRVIQFLKPREKKNNYFLHRYDAAVETATSSDTRKKSGVVKCTSPMLKFNHFLNQQILIRYLSNPRVNSLYSRDDLLGLLVQRFRKPTLAKAIFIEIDEDRSVILEYIHEQGIGSGLANFDITVFNGSETVEVQDETAEIYYPGLTCDNKEYCNRNLVHFDFDIFENVVAKWRNRDNPKDILQKLEHVKAEESPYQCKVQNGKKLGTRLILKPGAELRIQISKSDFKDHGMSLGWRMLRIGRNCHLCFTHVNYPEKAYMSDRNDVRQLITNETIIALRQATTNEILTSSKEITTKINWFGDYMGGGSFDVDDERSIKTRDLLCIRKEIPDGGNPKYIWCCHGIVNAVASNSVNFVVCTLSQPDDLPNNMRFRVTIIRPNEVESKVAARHRAEVEET